MARLADQFMPAAEPPRTVEQQSVCAEVRRRFGWQPTSVDFLKGGLEGVCSLTIGQDRTVVLVSANGMLVGIPLKKANGH